MSSAPVDFSDLGAVPVGQPDDFSDLGAKEVEQPKASPNPNIDMSTVAGATPGTPSPAQVAKQPTADRPVGKITGFQAATHLADMPRSSAEEEGVTAAIGQALTGGNREHPIEGFLRQQDPILASLPVGAYETGAGVKDAAVGIANRDPNAAARGGTRALSGAMEAGTIPMGTGIAQAPLRMGVGYLEAIAAGKSAEYAAKKMGLSPDEQEFANAVGTFLPMAYHTAKANTTLISERDLSQHVPGAPEGTTAKGVQMGPAGAMVTETPAGQKVLRTKVGPFTKNVTLSEGRQLPPGPVDPAAQVAREQAQTAASAMADHDALDQAAKNMANGVQPPQPGEEDSGKAPLPAGMERGQVTPQTVQNVGKAISMAPPEARGQMIQEAHQNLAAWMAQQGKVQGPDGQITVLKNPEQAQQLAAKWINDEVGQQQKAQEDAQKAQEGAAKAAEKAANDTQKAQAKAQKEAQKQSDKQQKEREKAGEPTIEQRAKTLLDTYPERNPVAVLQRNLGLNFSDAQGLADRVRQNAPIEAAPKVGGEGHEVIEEARATVDKQVEALQAGTIKAVHIPDGSTYTPKIPDGMKAVDIKNGPGAGRFIYDPQQIRAATIKEAAKAGTHGDLLGHVQTKQEIAQSENPVIVQARDQDGTVIQDSAVDGGNPGAVQAQTESLQERHPDAHISVVQPHEALNERIASNEGGKEDFSDLGAVPVEEQKSVTENQSHPATEVKPAEPAKPAAGEAAGSGPATPEVAKGEINPEAEQDPWRIREEKIKQAVKASKAAGNPHVDQLYYGVETMRGVHFRSLRDGTGGTITTVGSDNLVRYQQDDGKDDIVGRRETEEWVVDGRRNVKLNQKTREYQVTGPIPKAPHGVTGFPLPTAHTEEETPAKGADITKGARVTFADRSGKERTGTVAHTDGRIVRVKADDDRKSYSVATGKVKPADLNIGRTWNSEHGKQKVVSSSTLGDGTGKMYQVETEGNGEVRNYRASTIEDTIKRDEHRLTPEYAEEKRKAIEHGERLKERAAREQAEAKRDDDEIAAFAESQSPMAAGRTKQTLLKLVRYKDKPITRKALIEQKVKEGAKVETHNGAQYLVTPDGSMLGPLALSGIGMDYAQHLIDRRKPESLSDQGVEATMDASRKQGDQRPEPEQRTNAENDVASNQGQKDAAVGYLREHHPQMVDELLAQNPDVRAVLERVIEKEASKENSGNANPEGHSGTPGANAPAESSGSGVGAQVPEEVGRGETEAPASESALHGASPGERTESGIEHQPAERNAVSEAFRAGQRVIISGEGFQDARGNAVADDEGAIKRFTPASENHGFNSAVIEHPDGTETRLSWAEGSEPPMRAAEAPQAAPEVQKAPERPTLTGTDKQKRAVQSEIANLKIKRADLQEKYNKTPDGHFSPAGDAIRREIGDLTKQLLAKEDELATLSGQPTRAEKKAMQEAAASKPFDQRPDQAMTYSQPEQSQHWQVTEPDYVRKRFEQEAAQYDRGIEQQKAEVKKLKPGTKAHDTAASTLAWYEAALKRLRSGDEKAADKYKREYADLVKKAISKGSPVPEKVIQQYSEFRTAQTARERYEKGRHTSFANHSIAVNDTMQKAEGFKVKRQDGKEITPKQIEELKGGIDDIASVLGADLHDMMRGTDLTIAHTNGKHPFLSDAGGMYHPGEKSISAGINNWLGQPVRALAHEVGHWFDYESGKVMGAETQIVRSGGKRTGTHYASEADAAKSRYAGYGGRAESMYGLALKTMTDTIEVKRMLKVTKLSDLDPERRSEVERTKVVLGHYWREPREIFARLFEQYISEKLGRGGLASETPDLYHKTPGWWDKEAWAKLEPMIEAEVNKRLTAMRERYAPKAPEATPVATSTPTAPPTPDEPETPVPVTSESEITIGAAQPEHGNQRADIERLLRNKQESGRPAIIEGDQLVIPDGRYQLRWVDGRMAITKIHDLSRVGWESVLDKSGIGQQDRWTSFNKAAKDEFDGRATAKAEKEATEKAELEKKTAEDKKEKEHRAELQTRFNMQMRDRLKATKFTRGTVTPSGKNGTMPTIKGDELGGLLVHKSTDGSGTWDISHIKSGLIAGQNFRNLENARIGAMRMQDLADWTQDADKLKAIPGLFAKANELVKTMKEGATSMTPDELKAMETAPAAVVAEPKPVPVAVVKAETKAVAPGTEGPSVHEARVAEVEQLKKKLEKVETALAEVWDVGTRKNGQLVKGIDRAKEKPLVKEKEAIRSKIDALQLAIRKHNEDVAAVARREGLPLTEPEEKLVTDPDKNKWKYQAEYFVKALEPVKQAWLEKYQVVKGRPDLLDWKDLVKNSEHWKRPESRPAQFPDEFIRIEVPGDGKFLVVNTTAAIDKLLRSAPSAFAKPTETVPGTSRRSVPRGSKELDTEKLVQYHKAQIDELEQDLKRAGDKDRSFLQDQLTAARENLANAKEVAADTRPRPDASVGFLGTQYADQVLREAGLAGKKFWDADIAPNVAKLGTGAKNAGLQMAHVLYPRMGANADAQDILSRARGQLESHLFALEHIDGGLEKFFEKMSREAHLAFIDRYKLGTGQPDPRLQQIEQMMRAIDDRSLKAAQQFRPNLTAKENHFRVIWKVIPGGEAKQGQKSAQFTGTKRPFQGDKGFMKRATLETISEGINAGGEPITTNPWKLFTLAQASIMKYVAAQQAWADAKDLGMRKFVKRGEQAPEGWVKINDRIADVYFPEKALSVDVEDLPAQKIGPQKKEFIAKEDLETHKVMANPGTWYAEPGFGRLLNNYLSPDHIRQSELGKGLLFAKNLTTAVELSLSPFHAIFESLEAMGSQFGLGVQRAWNNGIRLGDGAELTRGLQEIATSIAAPYSLSRTGGNVVRYAENPSQFTQTRRGQAFFKHYPDAAGAMQELFDGGLTWGVQRDFRFDPQKSMVEAAKEGNYVGAVIRAIPWVNTVLMKPLFEAYIPRLKWGLALGLYSEQLIENADALGNGDTTRTEIARKVADTVENRFGEMNFNNIYWNNTFKSVLQLAFRSVTWKLGNWRGAGSAMGPEMYQAFRDPLAAMKRDWQNGGGYERRHYLPRIGMNQGWLLGMLFTTAVLGTIATKFWTHKWPWEVAAEDREEGYSFPGAVALEMIHPRTGRTNEYTGKPERISLPTGLRDFEHARRDPGGYALSSMSGIASHAWQTLENRDVFKNYVYDPNGSEYQKLAQIFAYNMPKPISFENLSDKYGPQDATSKALKMSGLGNASSSLDYSPAEQKMRAMKEHDPLTPEQVKERNEEHVHPTPKELRKQLKARNMPYVERLFKGLGYAQAREVYNSPDTSDHERQLLHNMMREKRQRYLKASR